ncbi:endodeoxyribonuclease RusA [Azorhizophilus paspali]|uniref:Endodeoxyribonuclease RusA n=1 Tax=Azorhizophilus paspali TaxID=69963 RepID=A0ABV6SHF4_AZOPA
MIELELPWPPKELSPNARTHWAKRSKVAKGYRTACHLLAKKAGLVTPAGRAMLLLEFVPPDRRRRDDDNMLASFKAGRDGLADALGIDDSRFVTRLRVSRETVPGGAVRVRISEFVEGEAA